MQAEECKILRLKLNHNSEATLQSKSCHVIIFNTTSSSYCGESTQPQGSLIVMPWAKFLIMKIMFTLLTGDPTLATLWFNDLSFIPSAASRTTSFEITWCWLQRCTHKSDQFLNLFPQLARGLKKSLFRYIHTDKIFQF